MAKSETHLPRQHEDWVLSLQPDKKPSVVVYSRNPRAGEVELVGQPGSVRELPQNKTERCRERQLMLASGLYMYTYTCVYTQTHRVPYGTQLLSPSSGNFPEELVVTWPCVPMTKSPRKG